MKQQPYVIENIKLKIYGQSGQINAYYTCLLFRMKHMQY